MAKGGKNRKRDNSKNSKKKTNHDYAYAAGDDDMMDDEIDAFHKQRDVVPLDVNEDIGESDEDNEHPVFDFEDANDEDEDDDEDMEDDTKLTGLAAKIARQQKYLRAKIGGVEDDTHDDAEDEEEKRALWGGRKNIYYSADNVDYELQSSDEELPAEEEAEVLRLQKEKAKSLSMEDFGLEDVIQDESDGEPTLEEILVKGKSASKVSADEEAQTNTDTIYEEVKKDLNALSRDEQMDVVYSSAPELVGLLSELNDALEQLENKVNPLLSKVREREEGAKGGMHYMEVKQLLLIAYCQAITFYLLLKSEGQPVRDHPVIARLVEIKNLLEKMKQLDENLPSELEEILNTKNGTEKEVKLIKENDVLLSNSFTKNHKHSLASAKAQEAAVPHEASELVKVDSLKDNYNRGGKHNRQNDEVGIQSMEMLKVRAALEEKLKLKGIFNSIAPKHNKAQKAQKHLHRGNGQLESFDDFDDDAINIDGGIRGTSNGHSGLLRSSKLSQLATSKLNKPKVVSGDDDLPKRDDIGERRRKHELRVLAGAGIKSSDDIEDGPRFDLGDDDDVDDDMEEDVGNDESEDEFYKQVKEQRDAKLAAKAEMYSRNLAVPLTSIPETIVDGKRQISYQMEKNRGLTRARKKLTKNPRKKYKLQHQKAVKRRQGQVREIKRPSGPYGGEASGINAGISRSIRLK